MGIQLQSLYRSNALRYTVLALLGLLLAFWILGSTWGVHFLKQSLEDYSAKIGYRIEYRDLRLSPLKLKLEIDGLRLATREPSSANLFSLERGLIEFNWTALLAGKIGIDTILLDGPKINLERGLSADKSAQWNWQTFIAAVTAALPPKDPASPSEPKKINVRQFNTSGFLLRLNDRPNQYIQEFGPIAFQLRDLANHNADGKLNTVEGDYQIDLGKLDIVIPKTSQRIQFRNATLAGSIDTTENDSLAIDLAAQLDSGKIVSHWLFGAKSNALSGKIALEQMPIAPVVSLLPVNKPLHTQSGTMAGDLQLEMGQGAWLVKGNLAFPDVFIREANAKAPLLAWKQANIEQLLFKKQDDGRSQLSIHELVLAQPQIQYEINEKGLSNFRRLFMKEGDTAEPAPIAPPAVHTTPENTPQTTETTVAIKKESSLFSLDLRSVQLRDGTMAFTDLAIKPKVEIQIQKLKGSLLGVSNAPGHFASIALDGVVANSGSMRAKGQMAFDDPRLNHDMVLQFRHLPLSDTNPYFMAFAGQHILGGRLDLTLNYKSIDGQLNGHNRFVIKKIELGEEVPDFTGKRLPLGLAVALLEDSDDIIDVNIDIAGNVNSPEFSATGLVWQAIRTVLTNVVTAPFRALASLLGLKGDVAINAIPGEVAYLPEDEDRLVKYSELLAKRPHATLSLIGTYDAERDRQELARAKADHAILMAAGFTLEPNAPLPTPSLSDKHIQSGVKSAYGTQVGRITLAQRIITLPDNVERYQQLRQELIAHFAVDTKQLQALGDARAKLAQELMMKAVPTLQERILVGPSKEASANRDGIPLEVVLGAK